MIKASVDTIILLLLLKCLSVNVRFWRTQIHNNNTISSIIKLILPIKDELLS